ncbi:hypothetical protein DEO72_LG10g2099 [Vigna unguiculata]|uniref:Uncharacterized protein n=1 Tax=Vigna unguiculata TaxID=3917 RepID=A0A4D6NFY6_VIGUN|nr:hypothetical protein DEO72_LG10g2099 [Vigna unguiculata]
MADIGCLDLQVQYYVERTGKYHCHHLDRVGSYYPCYDLSIYDLYFPFRSGFDTVYLDDDLRVVKDIRGDYLVVDRASYNWKE